MILVLKPLATLAYLKTNANKPSSRIDLGDAAHPGIFPIVRSTTPRVPVTVVDLSFGRRY